jgi:hypothetical protein
MEATNDSLKAIAKAAELLKEFLVQNDTSLKEVIVLLEYAIEKLSKPT